MKTILIAILFSIALVACQKEETPDLSGNNLLLGSWVNPQYDDSLVTYSRSDALIENEIGFTFITDDTFIYRQNSGWCGTPPITTADYKGTWSLNDNSVLNINVEYWGGITDLTWKVVSVDEQKLVISQIEAIYHQKK